MNEEWGECQACPDPCSDVGLFTIAYGDPFEIDTGPMKAPKQVDRQILIATGKSDWTHDVTQEGLAQSLTQLQVSSTPADTDTQTETNDLSFYNCSMSSQGARNQETVLLLPDYVYVNGDATTLAETMNHSHQALLNSQLTKRVSYKAVILICSHGTRDARCGKAAPILAAAFEKACRNHDLHLDTTGHALDDEDLEDCLGLFFVSHIGGHKFAGNVIIQLPGMPQIWLGRVLPAHVDLIVRETILGGKVPGNLLRGKINLTW